MPYFSTLSNFVLAGGLGQERTRFIRKWTNYFCPHLNASVPRWKGNETLKQIEREFVQAEEDAKSLLTQTMDDGTNTTAGAQPGKNVNPGVSPKGTAAGNGLSSAGRSPQELNNVINGFQVESNRRYAKFSDNDPNTYDTYCNLFASDVAKRFGAELPIYVTDGNGNVTQWLGATAMQQWLNGNLNAPGSYTQGPENGWRQISHSDAVAAANDGHLVVAAGSGHMAVVRAGGAPNADIGDVPIAQAGEINFNNGPLRNGWGNLTPQVQFFVHTR
jgi:hypothetical protein